MGLLSRAADSAGSFAESENEVVLDAIELALRERLGRLPQKKTTPYTALSLLKAYGTFQTGICLALKDNIYVSYASVGLGIGTIYIPAEKIWRPEKAREKYFMHESGKDLELKKHEDSFVYWIFPLISETNSAESFIDEPWEAVMILGVYELPFNAKTVSAILDGIAARILLKPDTELVKISPEENLMSADTTETDSIVEDFTSSATTSDDNSADISDSTFADESFPGIDETDSAIEDFTDIVSTGDDNNADASDSALVDETFISFDETDTAIENLTADAATADDNSADISDSTLADETFPGASDVSPYTNETDSAVEDFTASVPTDNEDSANASDNAVMDESFISFVDADSAVDDLIDIASTDDDDNGIASETTLAVETSSGTPDEIITGFNKLFPVFNCVVFDIPDYIDPGAAGTFSADVSRIVKLIGKVVPLNSGCSLVLLPPQIDRELIAHRLSKTFNTNILFSFEADCPESVINTIQPLL